jgi:general secretion pathway protein H
LRGFTLLEVLVVLVIMGVLLGLVSARMQPSAHDQLRVETERLAQLLDLAAEQSRITGTSIAWTANTSGYQFWRRTGDDDWSAIRDSDLLRPRSLPSGMSLSGFRTEAMPAARSMRVEFTPSGDALAFTVELSLGAEHYSIVSSPVGELKVVAGQSGQVVPDVGVLHDQMASH